MNRNPDKRENLMSKTNSLWYIAMLGLFVVVFFLAMGTYAWLSGFFSGKEDIPFETGTTKEIEAVMWMYDTEAEGAEKPGKWTSHELRYTDVSKEHAEYPMVTPYITPAATNKNMVGKFETKSLHLGTIDNLTHVKNDNIVYFRFKIDAAENGKNLKLDITHPKKSDGTIPALSEDDYLTIYGLDIKRGQTIEPTDVATKQVKNKQGNLVTIPNAVKAVDSDTSADALGPLLVFEYAVDKNKLVPNESNFSKLKFTKAWTTDAFNEHTLVKECDTVYDCVADADDDNSSDYYLYVKVSPNLAAWGAATKYLYAISPCQIMFDWEWVIDIH